MGVPEDEAHRPDNLRTLAKSVKDKNKVARILKQADGKINNAQLMYIHTNGSPARGIPARPVIEPALAANKELIGEALNAAADALLAGNAKEAEKAFKSAGQLGANAAKRWFRDPRNGWAENLPSTIKAKGSDRPLIDTGELRRSITYVVDYIPPTSDKEEEPEKPEEQNEQNEHKSEPEIEKGAEEVIEGAEDVAEL